MFFPVVVLSALSAALAGNATTVTGTIVSSIEDCSCTETPTAAPVAGNSSVPVGVPSTSAPALANGAAVKGAAAVAGVAAVGAYLL